MSETDAGAATPASPPPLGRPPVAGALHGRVGYFPPRKGMP